MQPRKPTTIWNTKLETNKELEGEAESRGATGGLNVESRSSAICAACGANEASTILNPKFNFKDKVVDQPKSTAQSAGKQVNKEEIGLNPPCCRSSEAAAGGLQGGKTTFNDSAAAEAQAQKGCKRKGEEAQDTKNKQKRVKQEEQRQQAPTPADESEQKAKEGPEKQKEKQ